MSPLLIGFFAMVGYGLFLLIRALPRLYRATEKKLVYCIIGFAVVAPIMVWQIARIPTEQMSIWLALPALVLFGIWACLGFFVESYRKKGERDAVAIKKPVSPPGLLRRNLLVLAIGLIMWLYGAFIGVENRQVEIVLLCVSFLLLVTSLGSLWRYRKF